jgi:hypothetical protein
LPGHDRAVPPARPRRSTLARTCATCRTSLATPPQDHQALRPQPATASTATASTATPSTPSPSTSPAPDRTSGRSRRVTEADGRARYLDAAWQPEGCTSALTWSSTRSAAPSPTHARDRRPPLRPCVHLTSRGRCRYATAVAARVLLTSPQRHHAGGGGTAGVAEDLVVATNEPVRSADRSTASPSRLMFLQQHVGAWQELRVSPMTRTHSAAGAAPSGSPRAAPTRSGPASNRPRCPSRRPSTRRVPTHAARAG